MLRRGLLRTSLSLFLLLSFAPSLLYCGTVNVGPALFAAATAAQTREDEVYAPIVPPASTAEFLTKATEATTYLADLPIDQAMARDLINKLLSAFIMQFNDEIANLLKAFGITLPDNWATIPLNYLLELIKFRSYNQDLANSLLAQWTANLDPQQEEALKRLWLSQTVVKTGFDSSLAMADDAGEGLYDLVDLVYGSTHVMKKIGSRFENLPVIGHIIKKIRLMIIERIIFALNNAVDLITAKMKEPARSRVRAIYTAVTTTYIKWAGIQVGDGFGGISPELLTKIGAKLLGKFLLLMPPKIGYVSITKNVAGLGAELARDNRVAGSFEAAAVAVLDDQSDAADGAVLESMVKTVMAKQKLSRQERQVANVAGAISQVAGLVHFIDPSSFARIVAIGAGILAGGLQLHTVFNSATTLYRLPGQVERGVKLAFDPQSAAPGGGTTQVAVDGRDYIQANPEYAAFLGGRVQASAVQFNGAMDALAAALRETDMARVETALDGVELASFQVRRDVKMLSTFKVASDGGPDVMRSLLGEGLMDHDLKSASLYADVLAYVFRPTNASRSAAVEKLGALREQTSSFMASVQEVATSGRIVKGAYVVALAPASRLATDLIEVNATVVSAGSEAVKAIRARLLLPAGYQLISGPTAADSETMEPGQELKVCWKVKKPAGEFKRAMLVVNVMSRNAPEANQSVMVTE